MFLIFLNLLPREKVTVKYQVCLLCPSSLSGVKPLHCFNTHYWLVNTVQRSPFFKDIILTIGNWNFAIWKEGVTVTAPIPSLTVADDATSKSYTHIIDGIE